MRNLRKRIWIDGFQTKMIGRMLFYCIAYQASLWVIIIAVRTLMEGMEAMTGQSMAAPLTIPAILAVIAFLGLLTYDVMRYVHRLVGPIYRFRKTVQAVAAGDMVERVRLRKGDFLLDLADDFNEMLEVLEQKGAIVIKDRQMAEQIVAIK